MYLVQRLNKKRKYFDVSEISPLSGKNKKYGEREIVSERDREGEKEVVHVYERE